MGSFSGTCGVSHLPIEAGDPIRVVLITGVSWSMNKPYRENGWTPPPKDAEWKQQRKRDHWRNGWWSQYFESDVFFPRTIPLRGTYDDYGGVEGVLWDSLQAQAMHAQFNEDLVEYPAGEFDIPPKVAKKLPLKELLHAVRDDAVTVVSHPYDKLKVPPEDRPHVPVGLWMVREDVYQALVNCRLAPPWDPPLEPDRYDEHVEEFIDDLKRRVEASAEKSDLDAATAEDAKLAEVIKAMKEMTRMVADYSPFGRSPPFENGVGFYVRWLRERADAGEIDADTAEVRQMVTDLAEFSMFRTAMYCCRVGWMPRAHGPQFSWTDAHVAVANVVLEVDRHVKEKAETP